MGTFWIGLRRRERSGREGEKHMKEGLEKCSGRWSREKKCTKRVVTGIPPPSRDLRCSLASMYSIVCVSVAWVWRVRSQLSDQPTGREKTQRDETHVHAHADARALSHGRGAASTYPTAFAEVKQLAAFTSLVLLSYAYDGHDFFPSLQKTLFCCRAFTAAFRVSQ